jgi:allophanate hydrolase subunit 2
MKEVGLMEKFALEAAAVVVGAKENVVAVEVLAARVTVKGMAAAMISVVGPLDNCVDDVRSRWMAYRRM